MRLSLIAAMAHHRVIGNNNTIPWHLSADLRLFKQTTLSKPIVMGRKTFNSIAKALPGRRNIVISRDRDLQLKDCEVMNSPSQALQAVQREKEVMIIGGATLYQQFLAQADRLYLSLIDANFNGDTFFPDYEQYSWQEVKRCYYPKNAENTYAWSFVILDRLTR